MSVTEGNHKAPEEQKGLNSLSDIRTLCPSCPLW
ncbi:MAG: HNH endonuclease [Planctomycetaceae bacterium]